MLWRLPPSRSTNASSSVSSAERLREATKRLKSVTVTTSSALERRSVPHGKSGLARHSCNVASLAGRCTAYPPARGCSLGRGAAVRQTPGRIGSDTWSSCGTSAPCLRSSGRVYLRLRHPGNSPRRLRYGRQAAVRQAPASHVSGEHVASPIAIAGKRCGVAGRTPGRQDDVRGRCRDGVAYPCSVAVSSPRVATGSPIARSCPRLVGSPTAAARPTRARTAKATIART
jgi:hypothetical protein